MASEPQCELACDAQCDLGESPVWDDATSTLYFVVRLLQRPSGPTNSAAATAAGNAPPPQRSLPTLVRRLLSDVQDINGKRIHAYHPASGSHRTVQLDQAVGTIVPTSNPNVLLAALEVRVPCCCRRAVPATSHPCSGCSMPYSWGGSW